jgi:eukaryotic-like serine/threonine-protein kinase
MGDHAPDSGSAATVVGDSSSGRRAPPEELDRGAVVGRYVVLSRLGAGGMGVVYAAYDPELDRKVALKLLYAGGAEASSRLLREAQSLAKLSHPNIVAVHDAGTADGRVWIAMEFVEGVTLRQWTRAQTRSWREVVGVSIAAGRGLAAAHGAGLVHRDVKPDNVMVGDDGRVRVMDFGLARTVAASVGASSGPSSPADVPRSNDATTRYGAAAGTPAYMAPEQYVRADVDARADQFGFGVTVWEALFGQRPFTGDTPPALFTAVALGDEPSIRGRGAAPAWLRRAIQRAIARAPESRWASMDELVGVLERGLARGGRRRGILLAGSVGVLVAGVLGMREVGERRRVASCEDEGAAIEATWNDDARAAVRQGLAASGVAGDAAIAEHTTSWLDTRARAWEIARTEACVDAEIHGRVAAEVHERALWCFDERRMQLEGVVVALARADAELGLWAVPIAAGLPGVEACRDVDALARSPVPAADQRDDVELVRGELSRAWLARVSGRTADANVILAGALARAHALEWTPLVAAVEVQRGDVLMTMGDVDDAERTLEDAYFAAIDAGAYAEAESAAAMLVWIVGEGQGRQGEGLRWARHAEAALALSGSHDALRVATLATNLGYVHDAAGNLAEAKALQEKALALRESVLGEDHPLIAKSLQSLANVHFSLGELEQAKSLQERALAVREATVGTEHPEYAYTLGNLANTMFALGDFEGAQRLHERSIAISERLVGADHPQVAVALSNLAATYHARGDLTKATELVERALAMEERRLGPDHPDIASTLGNLALIHNDHGDFGAAKVVLVRAVAILETAHGPESPALAAVLENLAFTESSLGEHMNAIDHYRRVLAMREHALGPTHIQVADTLTKLATAQKHAGDLAGARASQERAVELYAKPLGTRHPKTLTALLALAELRQ